MEDAEKEAKRIVEEAKKKQKDVIEQKSREAEKTVETMIDRAKKEAIEIKERAISRAYIKVRDEKLKAKGEVIDKVLTIALQRLNDLDDETYVQFLQNHLNNMSLIGNERLIVPENKRELVKRLQLPIELAEDETVESGFQIADDRTVLNFSFSSLLNFYEDELRVIIARKLFEE